VEAVDGYLTPDEAADILGVTRDRIDAMVEEGLLQLIDVDSERWLHRSEVEALRLQGG
jgi:excisionase family DNA binding protein